MPILTNARHERFAQELAKGRSASEAHIAAGYKGDDGNASKLANRPEIQARVQEITGKAAVKAGVTVERVITELARIGFADIRQVVSWRPEVSFIESHGEAQGETKLIQSRVTVLDSATLGDDTAAAVAEVSQSATGTLRIKMHDKVGALEKLCRALGMFIERREVGKAGAFDHMSDEELRDDIIRRAKELGIAVPAIAKH